GQSQSLRLGLEAVPKEAQGVLVLLSDQPGVSRELIDRLTAEFEACPADALIPTYRGERGSPVLLGRSLLPAAARLQGDTGARALLRGVGCRVRTVEVGHLGSPDDVDTPEEYERFPQRTRTL
ncbi:MAG: NTP transferase domain-containing protein, partial [Chloroflexota bacterium]|nr:NTP transferase domain-containing protein [Chloroflexota bacterium]